eukprot:NODE_1039_length_1847_cov_0.397597.p1 type:complete len:347 gc:universal NODE_1039_length_1847_cov_0.397597:240-1280(+)
MSDFLLEMNMLDSPISISASTDAEAFPYTCLVCGIAFSESEQQRQHHSSDWHKYNLKRNINGLEMLTAQEFQLKVEQKRALIAVENRELSYTCAPCSKSYSSENGYNTHCLSKKHLDKVGAQETSAVVEKRKKVAFVESVTVVNINDCLFCSDTFSDVEGVVDHMITEHEFFFPSIEFLINIRGLLSYLGHKVKAEYGCVWCHDIEAPEKGTFRSAVYVQQHMRDTGHCKIKFEDNNWNEYAAFYDFSSVEDPIVMDVDPLTNELVLEDNKKIGHRSWHKYYKQHYSEINDTKVKDKDRQVRKMREDYTEEQKEVKLKPDWRLKLGIKSNSQKHYRHQILSDVKNK